MKKIYRVKKEKEFQKVFSEGTSVANRQLVLYTFPKENQEHFRVGISVGKRIGNAVKRNQVKRYIRQALHELEDQIQPEWDFLVIARPDISQRDFFQVKKSLIHVMKLTHLLDQHPDKDVAGGSNEEN
ncbi:ribonuclease P protein component [Vaginisenegalia massiliensis]|uniref:ribonuclease P protein component n=1 Tax=Vaginisenegalia massiliensis TaxID=2058294 RepID=UPI000F534481|nr:ribonuclease P protein component [Vaginisenegalia massiliensis]